MRYRHLQLRRRNRWAPSSACARFAPSERPVPAPETGRPPELWAGGRACGGGGGDDQRAAGRPVGALARRAHTRLSVRVCVRASVREESTPRRDRPAREKRAVCVRARRCVPGSCVRACVRVRSVRWLLLLLIAGCCLLAAAAAAVVVVCPSACACACVDVCVPAASQCVCVVHIPIPSPAAV